MKYIEAVRLEKPIGKGSYLNDIPAIQWLRDTYELAFSRPVTFFVGENGTGKSTLLEGIAVACGFNPEGGGRNFSFSTSDTHSELCELLTISRSAYFRDSFFLRAESVYNTATHIEEMDKLPFGPKASESYGGSLHLKSHGESFMAIIEKRLGGNGLYIFDEPEAALSPSRQLELLGHIRRLEQENSQLIIATHSPILMAYPNAEILRFSEDGIAPVSYKQTEHYQITKQFLDAPERMLKMIFD